MWHSLHWGELHWDERHWFSPAATAHDLARQVLRVSSLARKKVSRWP